MSTILLIPLSLLLVLSVLRRAVDPACPQCASKRWEDHPRVLHCTSCGWTNAPPVVAAEAAAPGQQQYEFRLHA